MLSAAGSRLFLARLKLAMKRKTAIKLFHFALLLFAVGLRAGQAVDTNRSVGESLQKRAKATRGTGSAKKIDPCALLTAAEIEAVQGEPVKEIKPSLRPSGGLVMAQCFFRTATFAKSVSLALTTPDPANPSTLTPQELWRERFRSPDKQGNRKEKPATGKAPPRSEPEREKELREPRPIAGLGEESYWVGNRVTGALYVLWGDAFLRISVGGVSEESVRLKRSKTLARLALKRL